jgi:hypothetical protein
LVRAIQKTAERFRKSAFTAGAMHRVFICVGSEAFQLSLLHELDSLGFELVQGELNPIGVFPMEFLQHQGTHFNRKLFVLSGIDGMLEKLGSEVFRLLEFQRKQFLRTATWSLLWVRSFETADRIRNEAPGIWNTADEKSIFLPKNVLDGAEVSDPTAQTSWVSSLGEIAVPESISNLSIQSLMNASADPTVAFWRDILRLTPDETLLSFERVVATGKEVPAEMLAAVSLLAKQTALDDLAQMAEVWLKEFRWTKPTTVSASEQVLSEADKLTSAGNGTQALQLLNSKLDEWLMWKAYLWADRPLRYRALLKRTMGKISEAASDLDLWQEVADRSGLPIVIAAALEARAHHLEEMGDRAQAERVRTEAIALKSA